MNKKLSLLAVSVAMVLAGCGSDDSSSANSAQQTGQFIDAKVKGLYFEAQPSGLSGWTNENGEYQSKANDTITFYLGGKDGLKIGASSERGANGIITPFESMGKYDRAVTLARILQSLDADGDTTNDSIEIPETLTTNISEQALMAVNLIQLDDFNSATKLFNELVISSRVSEEEAVEHMKGALGNLSRGSNDKIDQFALNSGKIIRNISVKQTVQDSPTSPTFIYVHSDKIDDIDGLGMSVMQFKFVTEGAVLLQGSNDSSSEQSLNSKFKYYIAGDNLAPSDEMMPWVDPTPNDGIDNAVPDFGPLGCADSESGCTANKLNTMTDDIRNDSDTSTPEWQREIESGSYDYVTGIHTVVRQKIKCSSENTCDGRTTNYLDYYYEVPTNSLGIPQERYVDFTGTWELITTKPACEGAARSTMTFNQDTVVITGDDFGRGCNIEDMSGEMSLSELPADYWWFNQAGRETKATLTELNSTVRWYDDGAEWFNKWEYQPAGKEWDQGILTNRKMDSSGSTHATHYMQKVK